MNDSQILDLYIRRSEQAITETDARYGSYCQTIAYNILGNRQDSEECVNDTYLTAWNQIPPQRPRCFSAYLGKLTRNLSIDRFRRNHAAKRGGGRMEQAIEELERTLADPRDLEDAIVCSELTASINAFLRTLPESERRVCICRYFYLDSLPEKAGSKRIYNLHGSIYRNRCTVCGKRFDGLEGARVIRYGEGVPRCDCGGIIKPDVVLYEEGLDQDTIEGAVKAISEADVLIVGGTSLTVYPASGLIRYYRGNKLVLINRDETSYDRVANLVIHEAIGKVFSEL